MADPVYIHFPHGLGDCANFILVVRAYRQAGLDVRVVCEENKLPFFLAADVPAVSAREPLASKKQSHSWWEPGQLDSVTCDNILAQNKIWRNLKGQPLPNIADSAEDLWQKAVAQKNRGMFTKYREQVAGLIADLPRPVLLIHGHGNTSTGNKDMPAGFSTEIANLFLAKTAGSIIFLDWDNRVKWVHSSRIININHHYNRALTTPEALMGLLDYADLFLGIDSGPFHLAGLIDMPAVGLWFKHHPLRYALPRKHCLNLLANAHITNLWGALDFNIVEQANFSAEYVVNALLTMLSPRLFTDDAGTDAQLQLLLQKCFGGIATNTTHAPSSVVDRNASFSLAFKRLAGLKRPFHIVETGCIRADNDWAGAGYSTFLFGLFAQKFNGKLVSFDTNAASVAYAKKICATLPATTVMLQDSVHGLNELTHPVDLCYLDSMDVGVTGYAEHSLKETQAIAHKIAEDGLIIFDDTMKDGEKFLGKGELGVPWLLANGWKILLMGHQIVLGRV